MGYSGKSIEVITDIIHKVKSVCELGAQQNYAQPKLPAPYMSEWYIARGLSYLSIDLSGENDSKQWNLDEPVKTNKTFDLVTDFGTTEHLHDLYQGFVNVNKLTKVGGYMVHENPKTGSWPLHGYFYRDMHFYHDLAALNGYEIVRLEEHPAMQNIVDGWNVIAVMRKTQEGFIDREFFPQTYKS